MLYQIVSYTEALEERSSMEKAIETAESILNHINETIREHEGFQRLKAISEHLWIGHG